MKRTAIIILVLAAVAVGGFVWLASAHMTPPVQVVEQPVPDDHISH